MNYQLVQRLLLHNVYSLSFQLLHPCSGEENCNQFVCVSVNLSVFVCVCLSASISLEPMDRPSFTKFFVQIPCDCGSVLLWRRCDTLCTSAFMDDITFGRNGSYGDAWKAHCQPTTASSVAILGRSLMSMNALLVFVVVCLLLLYSVVTAAWCRSLSCVPPSQDTYPSIPRIAPNSPTDISGVV